MIPKSKTFRSPKYLDFIRSKPCLMCGSPAPSDPHHERLGEGGMGLKAPDTHALPLCRECHGRRHIGTGFVGFIDIRRVIVDYLTEYIGKIENART
jgi:hypothetical protein